MAITAETRTDIVELVVGMVGAAPGATILSELADVVDAGLSLEDLAIALADNAAFKALYPSFLTAEEFSTNFLTSLMGGNPGVVSQANFDLAVDALVSLLNAGEHRGSVMYQAITAISAVAEDDENFGAAAAQLNNKTEVAVYYSVTTQQSADTLEELQDVVEDVTNDDATVTSGKAAVDGTNNQGGTSTLTTGQDNVVGTNGNDTVLGIIDGSANTFTLGDVINLGDGTDAVKITTDQTAFSAALATFTGVESLSIDSTAVAAGANSVNANNNAFTTLTSIGNSGTDGGANALTFNKVLETTNVVVENLTDIATVINYSTISGTATDVATVEIAGSTETSGDGDNDLTIAGIDTLTLNFTTDDNDIDVLTAGDAETVTINVTGGDTDLQSAAVLSSAKSLTINATEDFTLGAVADLAAEGTITVTGAGDVDLNTLEGGGALLTLNASASTGDVTVTGGGDTVAITTGAGDDSVTAGVVSTATTLGAGDDSFDTNSLDYTAAGAKDVDAGAGTDAIIINDGNHLVAAAVAHWLNFEVLDVAGGTNTYDLDEYAFESVLRSGDAGAALTISNITDEEIKITGSAGAGTDEMTLALKSDTGDNALTFNIESTSALGSTFLEAGSLTNTQAVETINIVSSQVSTVADLTNTASAHNITMLDTNADTINVSGNELLQITAFEDGGAVNATIDTIDASASTGGLKMLDGVSTAGVSILGSETIDTLYVTDVDGAGDADGDGTGSTINAGGGGDIITIVDTGAVDTLIINAGDSKVGYTDFFTYPATKGDETYTSGSTDTVHFDIITGFTANEDTIDLGSFGFTGTAASALAGPALTPAAFVAMINGTTTSVTDFFVDTGVQRGVAVVSGINATTFDGAASSTLVFIDSNGDGDFTSADDDVLLLSGTATVGLGDFGF